MAGTKLWAVGFLRGLADELEGADRSTLVEVFTPLPLQEFHRHAARFFPALRPPSRSRFR